MSSVTVALLTPPITGGSLVLVTVRSKTSLTVLVPSSAVTLTEMVPISALVGVPDKVWVPALNVSQAGSGLSSDSVAV